MWAMLALLTLWLSWRQIPGRAISITLLGWLLFGAVTYVPGKTEAVATLIITSIHVFNLSVIAVFLARFGRSLRPALLQTLVAVFVCLWTAVAAGTGVDPYWFKAIKNAAFGVALALVWWDSRAVVATTILGLAWLVRGCWQSLQSQFSRLLSWIFVEAFRGILVYILRNPHERRSRR